jgi:hypothetical protein
MLSSHAFSHNNSKNETVIESNFYFEINSLDFILLINTTPSHDFFNGNDNHGRFGGNVDTSKYAVYETKTSSPQTQQTMSSIEQKQTEVATFSPTGTRRDEFGEYDAAFLSPKKGPSHDPVYAAMLLDSPGTQAGPYGFARLHATQTGE